MDNKQSIRRKPFSGNIDNRFIVLYHRKSSRTLKGDLTVIKQKLQQLQQEVRRLLRENKKLKKDLDMARALASHDPLTGAYSRQEFTERAEYFLNLLNGRIDGDKRVRKLIVKEVALCFIDLDFLKKINDKYGHHSGDHALCAVVQSIRENIRETDIVARLGGDEFVVLFPNQSLADVHRIACTIESTVRTVSIGENGTRLSASIGISSTTEGYTTLPELLRAADVRMYEKKRQGRRQRK